MQVNVSVVLKAIDGVNDLKNNDGDGKVKIFPLKDAIVNAVLAPVKHDEKGVDKVKKYELAKKVQIADGNVELTIEDITLIKERVGEVYPPLIVGQVFELLEV